MNLFKKWWPALGAFILSIYAVNALYIQLPHGAEMQKQKTKGEISADELVDLALASLKEKSSTRIDSDSGAGNNNPFQEIHIAEKPANYVHTPAAPPPPRHYVLKGTVGNNVASITNNSGQKKILREGNVIDSAQVISISPNRVILKDRAGTFELSLEK